jgi:cobalamin biosynthesis Mg chelatase CobN
MPVVPAPLNVPQNPGNVPQSTGNVPQSTGNVPQSTGNVPQSTGNVPQSTGNVPQSTGNVPQSPGNVPQNVVIGYNNSGSSLEQSFQTVPTWGIAVGSVVGILVLAAIIGGLIYVFVFRNSNEMV